MKSIRHAALGVLALVLAVAGCGRSSPLAGTGAGVAARVGGTVIDNKDVQRLVERALAEKAFTAALAQQFGEPGSAPYEAGLADFQRVALGRLITRELLVQMAGKEKVTVTDAQVTTRLDEFATQQGGRAKLEEAAASSGVPPADLVAAVRDAVRQQAIKDALVSDVSVSSTALHQAYDKAFVEVRAAHILVDKQALATSLRAQIRGGADFAALAKRYSKDASNKNKGGDLGYNGSGKLVPEFETAMFAAKPGQVVGPIKTQFGYHLIKVVARRLVAGAKSFTDATPELRRQALDAQGQERLNAFTKKVAGEVGVSVSPRFGVWNEDKAQVDPPKDDLSSPSGAPPGAPNGVAPTP